ncbi:MAG: CinA family nicotinamide mononucleotide deamidase-related protein [Bacteroidetes bacterium]|nr:CinA family nicotinamide mononucleotide deamidase-related protein [Bacteroidota bacterium]MBS1650367.1 CinA family nicotinamide mononucleotide deamidase-related protein [Bacteroidota bacterium]
MSSNTVCASIITIGDELLIGQVIDTNSAFIAQELNKIGVPVKKRVAVGDVWDDIWNSLNEESKHANIILITGGLGPTADDITKPLLCKYFNGKMVMHQPTLDHVNYLFEYVFKRPMPLLDRNKKQAEVPDVCTVLKNEKGTAPGMLFEKNGTIFIAMPGVPHEMKWLMQNQIIPIIIQKFKTAFIEHRTLLTAGIGESFLAEKIKTFEEALPTNFKLAYLPNYGMVRLRLSAIGNNKEALQTSMHQYFSSLKNYVKDVMIADEDISMQTIVGKLLKEKNKTVATAESCTGGYISHLLTTIPGSSDYYEGSIISYSYNIKEEVLKVPHETLTQYGAVSEETVKTMVQNLITIMNTDYGIAVSGIMGPGGETPDKPVGTAWIAVADKKKIITRRFHFRFDREKNIELTAVNALNLLRQLIVDNH